METIRESGPGDCRAIYSLICEMEEKRLPFPAFERIYNEQTADGNYVCLVYTVANEVVGCINLRMEYQLHHAERICEIMELAVSGDYRCHGIGRKLFTAASERARQMDCTQIEVCCNQLRKRTHKFYQERGMRNFHYKFSLNFSDTDGENRLGR